MHFRSPHSICILRLSAIGDVCHALSVVQHIQRTYPDCQLTWIMGKVEASLLGDLPGIKVVVFDKKQGLKGMRSVWAALKNERFDYLLHMQVALRASLLSAGIKARTKLGFSWKRAKEGQWLFTNKKLPVSKSLHVLDGFAEFAQAIGCKPEPPRWCIPLADADYRYANQQSSPYLVIAPCASKDERNWLPERYAAVADYASTQGMQVVLCGSPTQREQQMAEEILKHVNTPVCNLVGKTSLKELAALLKKADVVLAPDSGPAHIATTQGTPVIGLYAHSNPKRTGPYLDQEYVVSVYESLVQEQYGQPPEKLKWGTRVKGKDLMARITTNSVIGTLKALLEKRAK